jgi:hypothetical protein
MQCRDDLDRRKEEHGSPNELTLERARTDGFTIQKITDFLNVRGDRCRCGRALESTDFEPISTKGATVVLPARCRSCKVETTFEATADEFTQFLYRDNE